MTIREQLEKEMDKQEIKELEEKKCWQQRVQSSG